MTDYTQDRITGQHTLNRIAADLHDHAYSFFSMADARIDAADWHASDPEGQLDAFIAVQLIEARQRVRDYIDALARREANRTAQEAAIREAMAASVVAANVRKPEGYSRVQTFHVHGQDLALIPDDEAQFEQALNVVHLEHKGRVR